MGQIKAKSLIEKHGFLDPDKKTTEHDKIQTWVYQNFESILKELFQLPQKSFQLFVECGSIKFFTKQNTIHN